MAWHGGLGVFGGFVFQSDVAAIIGGAENIDEMLEIGVFLFLASALNLGLDLHGNGIRRQPRQVGVRVGADKIARVPIHAEPIVLDGLDDGKHLLDGGDEAAVIFQRKDDAELGGIITSLLDRLDAAGAGFLFGVPLVHVAGENANRFGAEPRSVIHPVFDILNLLAQLGGI